MLGIIGIISILSMSILVIVNLVVFQTSSSKLQKEALDSVIVSSASIDGDTLEKVIKNKSMESSEYKEVQEAMIVARSDKNVSNFYTLALGENNNTYFVVDTSLTELSELGEEYILNEEMKEAFNGQPKATKKPVKDDYGTFISGYAPIKNSSGEVIAIAVPTVNKSI